MLRLSTFSCLSSFAFLMPVQAATLIDLSRQTEPIPFDIFLAEVRSGDLLFAERKDTDSARINDVVSGGTVSADYERSGFFGCGDDGYGCATDGPSGLVEDINGTPYASYGFASASMSDDGGDVIGVDFKLATQHFQDFRPVIENQQLDPFPPSTGPGVPEVTTATAGMRGVFDWNDPKLEVNTVTLNFDLSIDYSTGTDADGFRASDAFTFAHDFGVWAGASSVDEGTADPTISFGNFAVSGEFGGAKTPTDLLGAGLSAGANSFGTGAVSRFDVGLYDPMAFNSLDFEVGNNSSGRLDINFDMVLDLAPGGGTLDFVFGFFSKSTFGFANGLSTGTLNFAKAYDANGNLIEGTNISLGGFVIDANPSPVPLPASIWMMLVTLAGLAGRRRMSSLSRVV